MWLSGANFDVVDNCNVSPVMAAAYGKKWDVVDKLVSENKVKIDTISAFDEKSLLHLIASSDNTLMLEILRLLPSYVNLQ